MNQSEPERILAAQPHMLEALRLRAKAAAACSRQGKVSELLTPPSAESDDLLSAHLLALTDAANILQFYGKFTVAAMVTNAMRDIAAGGCVGG